MTKKIIKYEYNKSTEVAILPKRCTKCNRLFWLEPYNFFYKTVETGAYSLSTKQIKCKNCICKENESETVVSEDWWFAHKKESEDKE